MKNTMIPEIGTCMKINRSFCFSLITLLLLFSSCGVQKRMAKEANQDIFSNADFAPAHIGISLYEPATKQYLYNYQGDKFFIPASNMKIFTCYAAMKYLGDSLVALRYVDKGNGTVEVEANGDASFLHPDFKNQPAADFLKKQKKILLTDENWKDNALGAGWAWDDYNSDYMAERSAMPIYGNIVQFKIANGFHSVPALFEKPLEMAAANAKGIFSIRREYSVDIFSILPSVNKFSSASIPFYTSGNQTLVRLLSDTLQTTVELVHFKIDRLPDVVKIYSQPTDSLLKIMMHRSDNFYAEQTLLMISNERLGMMNDSKIIDTLLKTDLRELPQKPKWVDGSGLSRYNLVSPQDFVWILTQMKNEFKWERIREIFSTGGAGTLSGSYKNYAGLIYAKTGTLSNHVALSGYITTKKGKQLVFSVLVNAHQTAAANIRKGVERFLTAVIEKY
jgi:D-alanyl-D-alanine carboxypeptidase/D-alanyl-D-alanine-endopeptidase (penicillin-binding protein 4)